MFLVYFKVIFEYIVSKEGKLLDPNFFNNNNQYAIIENLKGHTCFKWHGLVL
jgi:hypothetical protein